MANKKPKNTKNTKAKTAKKTNEQIAVEGAVNAAKKLHKKNPKLLIATVAIVVTAAIIVGALYIVKPEWFRGPMPESGQLVVHYIDVGQGATAFTLRSPTAPICLSTAAAKKGAKSMKRPR